MPFQTGQKPHNFQDLTGQKFNMLYVESFAGRKGESNSWNCICDCGNRKVITSYYLTSGKTKSCGCLRKSRPERVSYIIGYENEDIVVVSLAERTNGRWYCNCKCKHCGKINKRSLQNVKSGNASCRCIHNERIGKSNSKEGRNTAIYRRWVGMKTRCMNKNDNHYHDYGGRGITICKEWLDFDVFYKWSMDNGYKDGYSIERKDVNGNYCPENCCWIPLKDQAKNKRNTLYITINGQTKRLKEWCEIYNSNYKVVYQRIFRYGMEPLIALNLKNGGK